MQSVGLFLFLFGHSLNLDLCWFGSRDEQTPSTMAKWQMFPSQSNWFRSELFRSFFSAFSSLAKKIKSIIEKRAGHIPKMLNPG